MMSKFRVASSVTTYRGIRRTLYLGEPTYDVSLSVHGELIRFTGPTVKELLVRVEGPDSITVRVTLKETNGEEYTVESLYGGIYTVVWAEEKEEKQKTLWVYPHNYVAIYEYKQSWLSRLFGC